MRELEWHILRELDNLSQRMQDLLDSAVLAPSSAAHPATPFPPVDVFETPEAVVVEAEIPGVAADGLRVELSENRVILAGELGPDTPPCGETLLRMERPRGKFHRAVSLPCPVTPPFEATLSQGVLVVRLPKAVRVPRWIPIAQEGV
ncbi:MAG: Hsp20 family protein [Thermoanaerobaculum sp.]|nr:Hsp20 family protein [Thermoanaerobaculum sp.]